MPRRRRSTTPEPALAGLPDYWLEGCAFRQALSPLLPLPLSSLPSSHAPPGRRSRAPVPHAPYPPLWYGLVHHPERQPWPPDFPCILRPLFLQLFSCPLALTRRAPLELPPPGTRSSTAGHEVRLAAGAMPCLRHGRQGAASPKKRGPADVLRSPQKERGQSLKRDRATPFSAVRHPSHHTSVCVCVCMCGKREHTHGRSRRRGRRRARGSTACATSSEGKKGGTTLCRRQEADRHLRLAFPSAGSPAFGRPGRAAGGDKPHARRRSPLCGPGGLPAALWPRKSDARQT